jgi:Flp pilus assembly protein TadD
MAVYWAKEALSYNPDDWQIWDTLGALYYKLKRKKEAVETLAKAIALAQAKNLPEESYQETQELLQKAQALE